MSFEFMGRPFQVNVLLRNLHSMDRCLPTLCLPHPVWPFTAGYARMCCLLPRVRKALGWVGGFFIRLCHAAIFLHGIEKH